MKTQSDPRPVETTPRRRGAVIASAAMIGVLAMGTALVKAEELTAHKTPTNAPTPVAASLVPADFSSVIERVSPAVVNVQVTGHLEGAEVAQTQQMPPGMEEFFRRFFGDGNVPQLRPPHRGGQSQGPMMHGLGSGFVIDPAGYIVTNHHVVDKADKITVTLQGGRSLKAKLVGSDPETDLALIKVDAGKPLPYVSFSKGPTPRPGQWVIAVGNPFGLDHTATAGIVSATGRAIGAGPYDDFIQIDAPINKGNSGGPTFNLAGQVVGVNTAIFSPNGGSVGIGFAIPASTARSVIAQLRENGSVSRGWLGVTVQGVTADIADGLGLDKPKGAIIARIMPDGPAAKSDLQAGDVVLSVDGKPVRRLTDLTRRIAAVPPGHTTRLEILHAGDRKTISVKLGKRPGREQLASAAAGAPATDETLGMQLAPAEGGAGVSVAGVDPDGAAAQRGIQPGDVILSVGQHKVKTPADVTRRLAAARRKGDKAALMLMERNGERRFVSVPLGRA